MSYVVQEFLQRLDTCTQDLSLGITIDLQKDLKIIASSFLEDNESMRIFLEEFRNSFDEKDKKQEAQFHILKDGQDELLKMLRLDGSAST